MLVKITNFQSIESCTIDIPENSFTCLVGPTNIGKSAIRRALECVLYNKSEVSYIREGAKECIVEITLADGTFIKWSRDKKTAKYEVNGEAYAKLSGSVPEPILDKGFKELSLSKDKLSVQIAHQFDNIFLLNQTGSRITEVLSNLGNLNKIISANKICLTDKKGSKSKLKIRKEDLLSEKEKFKSFEGLDEQRSVIEGLRNILEEAKLFRNKKKEVLKYKIKLDKSLGVVSNIRKIKDLKVPLDDISLDSFITLTKLHKKHINLNRKLDNYVSLIDHKDLSFNIDDDLAKFAKLKKIYENLKKKEESLREYSSLPNELSELDLDTEKTNLLKDLYLKLERSKNKVLRYRNNISQADVNFSKLENENQNLREELKVCPLCDSSIRSISV